MLSHDFLGDQIGYHLYKIHLAVGEEARITNQGQNKLIAAFCDGQYTIAATRYNIIYTIAEYQDKRLILSISEGTELFVANNYSSAINVKIALIG